MNILHGYLLKAVVAFGLVVGGVILPVSDCWGQGILNFGTAPRLGALKDPGVFCEGNPLKVEAPDWIGNIGIVRGSGWMIGNRAIPDIELYRLLASDHGKELKFWMENQCGSDTARITLQVKSGVVLHIDAPAAICAGGVLALEAPSNSAGLRNGGWTLGRSLNPSLNAAYTADTVLGHYTHNGAYLAYHADTDCGMVWSNTVAVAVNGKPELGPLVLRANICAGTTLQIEPPQEGECGSGILSRKWEILGGSADGRKDSLLVNVSDYEARYADHGRTLRYTVVNGCGTTVVSAVLNVSDKPSVAAITDPGELCTGVALSMLSKPTVEPNGSVVTAEGWYTNGVKIDNIALHQVVYGESNIIEYNADNYCGRGVSTIHLKVNGVPENLSFLDPKAVCSGDALALPVLNIKANGSTISDPYWTLGTSADASRNPAYTPGTALTVSENGYFLGYRVTASCGGQLWSETHVVTVNVLPAATISGGGEVCKGTAARATVTLTTGEVPFLYALTGDGEALRTGSSKSTTVDLLAAGTFVLTSLRDGNGCLAPAASLSGSVTVSYKNLPTLKIAVPDVVCDGEKIITPPVEGLSGAGLNFGRWTLGLNADPSKNPEFSILTILKYERNHEFLAYGAVNPCGDTVWSNQVPVTVSIPPTMDKVAGYPPFCVGDTIFMASVPVNYYGSPVLSAYWSWSYTSKPTGWAWPDTVVANIGQDSTWLTYRALSNCGLTYSNSVLLTVNSVPTVSDISWIISSEPECIGLKLRLKDQDIDPSAGNVLWSGWNFGANTDSNKNPEYDGHPLTSADDGHYLSFGVRNACGTGWSNSLMLDVVGRPSVQAPAPVSACAGEELWLTPPVVNTDLRAPLKGQGWTLGKEPAEKNVAFIPGTKVYAQHNNNNLGYWAENSCGKGWSVSSSKLTMKFGAEVSLSGTRTICGGESAVITLAVNGGKPPYAYTFNGTSYTNQSAGQSFTVSPTATTGYSVTNFSDAGGCAPINVPVVEVNPGQIWVAPTTETGVALQVRSVAAASVTDGGDVRYTWTVNGTLQAGATGVELSYTPTKAQVYQFIRTAYAKADASKLASTFAVSSTASEPVVVTPGAISAPASYETGETILVSSTYAGSASDGKGVTYSWTLNGSNISGSTAILSYVASNEGRYTFVRRATSVTDPGKQAVTAAVVVAVNNPPVIITIDPGQITGPASVDHNTPINIFNVRQASLSSGGAVRYSWTVNGNAVFGTATTLSYMPPEAGRYEFVRKAESATDALLSAQTTPVAVMVKTPPPTIDAGAISCVDIVKLGESVVVSSSRLASMSDGSAVRYSWTVNGSAVSGTGATFFYTPTVVGNYVFVRTAISEFDSKILGNASATVVVAMGITAGAITPPTGTVYLGSLFTIGNGASATASSGGVTYSWTVNGSAVSGAGATLNYTASSAGTYDFVRKATSVADNTKSASTTALRVTVAAITVTPGSITAPASAISGAAFTVGNGAFATASSGGVTYSWTVNGATVSGTAATLSYTAPAAGTYAFVRKATSVNDPSKSANATVSVLVALGLTPGGGCTDDDGNSYKTVIIGDQEWMAEDLKAKHKCGTSWDNGTYGRLYDWAAAMNCAPSSDKNPSGVQGLCPDGWYLPSDAEWTQLENYLTTAFPGTPVGTVLKSKTGWNDSGNGTDNVGFCGLPSGSCNLNGYRYNQGRGGYWWSSTEVDSYAWNRYLFSSDMVLHREDHFDKRFGSSIRCLSNLVTVTPGSITAPAEAAAGTAFTVGNGASAIFLGGVTYSWTVNGAAVSGTGITLSYTAPSAGTYKIVRKATSILDGTKSASTPEIGVTVDKAITVYPGSITAPTSGYVRYSITIGNGGDASASSGGVTYSWTVNGVTTNSHLDTKLYYVTPVFGIHTFVRKATSVMDGTKSASTSAVGVLVKIDGHPTFPSGGNNWSDLDECTSCTWQEAIDKCKSFGMRLPHDGDWGAVPNPGGLPLPIFAHYWSSSEYYHDRSQASIWDQSAIDNCVNMNLASKNKWYRVRCVVADIARGNGWSEDECTSCTWQEAINKCNSLGMRLPNDSDWGVLPKTSNVLGFPVGGYYWSATEVSSDRASYWYWYDNSDLTGPISYNNNKGSRLRVRCVRK